MNAARVALLKFLWFGITQCVAHAALAQPPALHMSAAIEARGGALLVEGLEVLSEIGAFEIYKVGPGARATLLAGPSVGSGQRQPLGAAPFALKGAVDREGMRFDYQLSWVSANTLRVQVTYRSTAIWPTGAEVCIGKLPAGLFAGAMVTSDGETSRLPRNPRPVSDRFLLRNRSSLSVRASFVDITIVPLVGDISLSDFRLVSWDPRRSFYIFTGRHFVMPGETATFSYDVVISNPTLASSAQFERSNIDPVLPVGLDDGTFFAARTKTSPDLAVRGVMSELLPPARKDISLFKGYIRAIAKAQGNTLVLYHWPEHVLALHKGNVAASWWRREDLVEIADYAHSHGIQVIPGMSSKFNSADFPGFSTSAQGGFYNTFDEKSYDQLFALYATLLEIYRPKALLIGHDEIRAVGAGKASGWSDARAFAADIVKISGWLRAKGVKTLMFGDMLLDRGRWPSPLTANANKPMFASTDTHEAIDHLPRDVIILDWQYSTLDDYPTIEYFKKKGFGVWGVSWYDPVAAVSLARSVVRYGGDGILASDWGFWATLSPAAVSLYGVRAGYDSALEVRADGEDAVVALAAEMRGDAEDEANGEFAPVDLEKVANETTQDAVFGDGRGFVDLGSGLDLRALPAGRNVFGGVPFQVLPSGEHSKPNCVIATGPQELTIPMGGGRVVRLAFLHTMRQAQPRLAPRLVGEYEVIYTNGSRRRIPLLENYNMTDVRAGPGVRTHPWNFASSPDVLVGSSLGWRGPSLSGMPMNLQVLRWSNPDPDIGIERIVIRANKGVSLVLIGLSRARDQRRPSTRMLRKRAVP